MLIISPSSFLGVSVRLYDLEDVHTVYRRLYDYDLCTKLKGCFPLSVFHTCMNLSLNPFKFYLSN